MPKNLKLISTLIISTLVLAGCASATQETDDDTSQTPTVQTPETTDTQGSAEDAAGSESAPDLTKKPVITATMTDTEIVYAALMGPDGEYAAAASYEAVLNKYGTVEPYATIYQAELRHIDALIRQLEKAGVAVPANPYTGKITAPGDLTTAAKAWAEGEILNVELYDDLIKRTTNENLLKVLGNLRSASLDSHLPAFELAAKNGGTLTAEQMSRR